MRTNGWDPHGTEEEAQKATLEIANLESILTLENVDVTHLEGSLRILLPVHRNEPGEEGVVLLPIHLSNSETTVSTIGMKRVSLQLKNWPGPRTLAYVLLEVAEQERNGWFLTGDPLDDQFQVNFQVLATGSTVPIGHSCVDLESAADILKINKGGAGAAMVKFPPPKPQDEEDGE